MLAEPSIFWQTQNCDSKSLREQLALFQLAWNDATISRSFTRISPFEISKWRQAKLLLHSAARLLCCGAQNLAHRQAANDARSTWTTSQTPKKHSVPDLNVKKNTIHTTQDVSSFSNYARHSKHRKRLQSISIRVRFYKQTLVPQLVGKSLDQKGH